MHIVTLQEGDIGVIFLIFIFEREYAGGGAESVGDRGLEVGSALSSEPNVGLEHTNHEMTT